MPTTILLLTSIMNITFGALLMRVALYMMQVTSMKKEIEQYRKDPSNRSWVPKFFFGFIWLNAAPQEWFVNNFGDKPWTIWIKISGGIFFLFSLFFIFGTIALWFIPAIEA